jgi:hypothetical protein
LFPQLLIFSVVGDGVFGARSLPDSATRRDVQVRDGELGRKRLQGDCLGTRPRLLGEPPGEHPHSLARESFPDWDREYVIGGD